MCCYVVVILLPSVCFAHLRSVNPTRMIIATSQLPGAVRSTLSGSDRWVVKHDTFAYGPHKPPPLQSESPAVPFHSTTSLSIAFPNFPHRLRFPQNRIPITRLHPWRLSPCSRSVPPPALLRRKTRGECSSCFPCCFPLLDWHPSWVLFECFVL